jgi:hypothetical protein
MNCYEALSKLLRMAKEVASHQSVCKLVDRIRHHLKNLTTIFTSFSCMSLLCGHMTELMLTVGELLDKLVYTDACYRMER